VPGERRRQVAEAAVEIGPKAARFPWADGVGLADADPAALLLANTWEPCLSVTGMDGVPPGAQAGNVLRPFTEAVLSFRLPPPVAADRAAEALVEALTTDPPPGAVVAFDVLTAESGWDAPPTASWLADALERTSLAVFGRPSGAIGEGGTIPFMGMLGARFPAAQFLVTGVLGPGSNAHGPNEFLHLDMAGKLTTAVAHVLDAHAGREVPS
jgi:acetylornithine deacetylase/succinyl-diaminopimelate desuccinylase-like protein